MYAPVLFGLVLLITQVVSGAGDILLPYFWLLVQIATLFSLLGAIVWIASWLRSEPGSRLRARQRMVAIAFLCWIPPILVMAGVFDWNGLEGLLNLSLTVEATRSGTVFHSFGSRPLLNIQTADT